jgi:hypothetical protein
VSGCTEWAKASPLIFHHPIVRLERVIICKLSKEKVGLILGGKNSKLADW